MVHSCIGTLYFLLMSRNNNGMVFPILNDFRVLWVLGSVVFGFWISFSGSIRKRRKRPVSTFHLNWKTWFDWLSGSDLPINMLMQIMLPKNTTCTWTSDCSARFPGELIVNVWCFAMGNAVRYKIYKWRIVYLLQGCDDSNIQALTLRMVVAAQIFLEISPRIPGEMIQFDEHIFSKALVKNHQLVRHFSYLSIYKFWDFKWPGKQPQKTQPQMALILHKRLCQLCLPPEFCWINGCNSVESLQAEGL